MEFDYGHLGLVKEAALDEILESEQRLIGELDRLEILGGTVKTHIRKTYPIKFEYPAKNLDAGYDLYLSDLEKTFNGITEFI